MDFVWELNAAESGLYEPRQLILSMIARDGDLAQLAADAAASAPERDFFAAELERSISSLAELEQDVGTLLGRLRQYARLCEGGESVER